MKNQLLFLVWGFTGSKNEHQYFSAIPFFNDRGYATYRFNLYGGEADARKTSEVRLTDHITDTKSVIDYFSADFDEIYLVGHSLGACVACLVDQSKLKKVVLWNPTHGFESPKAKGMHWVEHLEAYICDYRMQIIFGKNLIEEWMRLTFDELVKSLKVPTKIIFAGNYNKYDEWKDILPNILVENDYVIIPGASHAFVEEGVAEKLFEETYKWFS